MLASYLWVLEEEVGTKKTSGAGGRGRGLRRQLLPPDYLTSGFVVVVFTCIIQYHMAALCLLVARGSGQSGATFAC